MVRRSLHTERLLLRPSSGTDASRAFEIRSDWEVARMLSMAAYPPVQSDVAAWFDEHAEEWQTGRAYRFAIDHQARMIGLVDLDAVADGVATLGYWLERSAWGQGFALEASQAVLGFALDDLKVQTVRAGHAADNPASGRILTKLGFQLAGKAWLHSKPRAAAVEQWRYVLDRRP